MAQYCHQREFTVFQSYDPMILSCIYLEYFRPTKALLYQMHYEKQILIKALLNSSACLFFNNLHSIKIKDL